MNDSVFSKKRILLLGSGELGKELVIESKRLGLEVIAIDLYEKAPAMQVADYSRVIDMGDKNILKNVIKEFKPDYVVPEIEALSIEALKELEDEGFNIVPNARTVEITMNRDKIRDLASKDLKIKTDSLTSLKLINYDENILTISYEKSKININEVISFINMKKANIIDMSTDDGKLEDVFIRLTNS